MREGNSKLIDKCIYFIKCFSASDVDALFCYGM